MVHVYKYDITIKIRFKKQSLETLIIGVWRPKPIYKVSLGVKLDILLFGLFIERKSDFTSIG
jgi:hypothetical protein